MRTLGDIAALLTEKDLEWSRSDDGVWLSLACRVGAHSARLNVTIDDDLLLLNLALPAWTVPRHALGAAAIAVCQINDALRIQGFSVNPGTGALSFRLAWPCGSSGLSGETLGLLMSTCLSTAEAHGPELGRAIGTTAHLANRSLHVGHPALGPAMDSAPRYGDVLAYLRKQGQPAEPPGHAEEQLAPEDLLPDRPHAVIRDLERGPLVGFIDASGPHVLDEGRMLPEDEPAFERRLRALKTPILATYRADDATPTIVAALERLGFGDPYQEIVVGRALTGSLPPVDARITCRAEIPSLDLLDLALHGTPNRGLLGAGAGPLRRAAVPGEARWWRIAYLGEEIIGLLLLGIPDEHGSTGLRLIAVLPQARGRGLGRALHTAALHELVQLGGRHYLDMTDVENVPMQRIMFWNGCQSSGVLRNLRLLPR